MSNKNLEADEDAGCCAGVIFYQMLYGKKPFGEDQSQEMYAPHPTDFPHFFCARCLHKISWICESLEQRC